MARRASKASSAPCSPFVLEKSHKWQCGIASTTGGSRGIAPRIRLGRKTSRGHFAWALTHGAAEACDRELGRCADRLKALAPIVSSGRSRSRGNSRLCPGLGRAMAEHIEVGTRAVRNRSDGGWRMEAPAPSVLTRHRVWKAPALREFGSVMQRISSAVVCPAFYAAILVSCWP